MTEIRKIVAGALIAFCLAGVMNAKEFKFAFGGTATPPPAGYIKVSGKQLYEQSAGYGWVKICAYDAGPFAVAKSEQTQTSCECKPGTIEAPFRVDLPNGIYQVKVYVGHVMPTEGRKVCLAINNKIVIAPPGAGGWGTMATPVVPAVVTDGRMDVMFYAAGGRIAVFALEITEVKDKELSEKFKQQFEDAPEYKPEANAANNSRTEKSNLKAESVLVSAGGKVLIETGHHPEQKTGAWLNKYKNNSALIYTRANQGEILNYSIPKERELIFSLNAFSTNGEKCSIFAGIYAIKELKDITISVSPLKNGNAHIPPENIKIFTVTSHPQATTDRVGDICRIVPELFERNMPFSLPEGKTQPLYILFSIPVGIPTGVYLGELVVSSAGEKIISTAVKINVLNLKLAPPDEKKWVISTDAARWREMKQAAIDSELKDMVDHGINSFIINLAPGGGSFKEENGKITGVDFGKVGKSLSNAKQYIVGEPEIILSATNQLSHNLSGWQINQKGNTDKSFTENEGKRCLVLKNNDESALSSIRTAFFGFMDGGQTLKFKVRYRLDATTKAIATVSFYDQKRKAVKPSNMQLALNPTGGKFAAVEGNVTLPPEGVSYIIDLNFKGGTGTLMLDYVELCGGNGVLNPNAEFERPLESPDLNKPWSPEFIKEYMQAVTANAESVKNMGFQPVIEGKDEAGNDAKEEYSEISELKYAGQAGYKTFCNLSPALAEKAKACLDMPCFYADSLGDEKSGRKIISEFQKAGKKVYYIGAGSYVTQDYDMMTNRFGTGAFLWKSGCDGTYLWTYQRYSGNPFDDFDGPYHDYCMVYPPRKAGEDPVVTNAWEGVREGWTDYRYFTTLESEVAKAEKNGNTDASRKGSMVVKFLKNAIPWYGEFTTMAFDSAAANDLRWFAAWTAMKLQTGTLDSASTKTIADIKLHFSAEKPVSENKADKTIFCPVTEKVPVLDGKLDDDAWKNASEISQFYNYMNSQIKASNNTNVLMLHDSENIYLGFRCYEKDIAKLKTSEKIRDGNIFEDDCVEMFFDTANSGSDFFQLCFNASGSIFDLKGSGSRNTSAAGSIFAVDYKKEKVRDAKWNGDWTVKTSRHADRWEAEVKIPFSAIGRSNDVWGILFGRSRKAGTSETTCSKAIGFFDQPEFFSRLVLTGGRDGKTSLKKWQFENFKFGMESVDMLFSDCGNLNIQTAVSDNDGKTRKVNFPVNSNCAEIKYDINENSARLAVNVLSEHNVKVFNFEFPLLIKDAIKVISGRPLFYVGSNTAEFILNVNVSETLNKSGSIRCSLLSDTGTIAQSAERLAGSNYKVSFDTDKLEEGFYRLKFDILDETGKIQISSICDFAVIPHFITCKSK